MRRVTAMRSVVSLAALLALLLPIAPSHAGGAKCDSPEDAARNPDACGCRALTPDERDERSGEHGTPDLVCGWKSGGQDRSDERPDGPPSGEPDPDAPVFIRVTYSTIEFPPEGACIGRGQQIVQVVTGNERQEILETAHSAFFVNYEHLIVDGPVPACPGEEGEWNIHEALRAQLYVDLPDLPTLSTSPSTDNDGQPARVITGKPLYLDTNAEMTWQPDQPWTLVDPITGFPVTIDLSATSVLEVLWGDEAPGEPAEVFDDPGGPWPHGEVTHTYTDAAPSVFITVTQRWTINWSVGGRSSSFVVRTTPQVTDPFRVVELRPVREH